jgi:hypothetical protein
VHQEIAVVAEDPLALLITLNAGRQLPVFLELYPDLVGNRLNLARVRARADDEVIGERGDPGEVQNSDIGGLLFLSRANGREPSGFGLGF